MKKGKISWVIGSILAAIIINAIVVQFSSNDNENRSEQDNSNLSDIVVDPHVVSPTVWQTSGSFQIDKTQYRLGELVLMKVENLMPDEKGQILFLRQLNETHYDIYITIPFDGAKKHTFNQYFKPTLSKQLEICSKTDLIGNWIVMFKGTNHSNLKFKIIDEIIPGNEESYDKIC